MMTDEHNLPGRVTFLEQSVAKIDTRLSVFETEQRLRHQENTMNIEKLSKLSEENGVKLDKIIKDKLFSDGEDAGKVSFYKGVALILGIASGYMVLLPVLWPHLFNVGK